MIEEQLAYSGPFIVENGSSVSGTIVIISGEFLLYAVIQSNGGVTITNVTANGSSLIAISTLLDGDRTFRLYAARPSVMKVTDLVTVVATADTSGRLAMELKTTRMKRQ